MHVSFGASQIEIRTWGSRAELLSHLSQLGPSYALLGQDSEVEKVFCSATVYLPGPGDRRIGYGVVAEGHGLVPQLLLQDPQVGLMVGFNREVVGLDAEVSRIRFRHRLDALFWTFLATRTPDVIVAVHEIGAVALSADGAELWRCSKDLVTDYAIVGDELRLTFADDPPVRLALATGREVVSDQTG